MDAKRYCELLMRFKTRGVELGSYMGIRWFVLKAILIVAAAIMLVSGQSVTRGAGLVIVGYLIGIVAGDVRKYVVAKSNWAFQEEVIDWEKVKERLG